MKREEILSMTAGVELNVLVAEKVMCLDLNVPSGYKGVVITLDNREVIVPKQYSTDISAVWDVIEKLKETNDCVTLAWNHDSWQCHVCLILPQNEDGEWKSKETMYDSPSAPEAICIASLLAILEGETQ